MEPPSELINTFKNEVKDFFTFLSSVNDYIFDVKGKRPVDPFTLSIVQMGINTLTPDFCDKIMETFASRAIPHYEYLHTKDLHHFKEIAPSLFQEVSKGTIDSIVECLVDDKLPDDTKDSIFESVEYLLELAIKRQIQLIKEGRNTVSRTELSSVAKNFPSIQDAYFKVLE